MVNEINNNYNVNHKEYDKEHLIYYIRATTIFIFILYSYFN